MKSGKRGVARIAAALFHSMEGLASSLRHEEAFRQEFLLFLLLLPPLVLLPVAAVDKGLLLAANSLVLIVELLNSAIEAVVDMVSPEFHTLAKRAKDTASAAVFLSILLTVALWGWILYTAFANR